MRFWKILVWKQIERDCRAAPAFEIENCALQIILAVWSYQKTAEAKCVAHTSAVEKVVYFWQSGPSCGELVSQVVYIGYEKLATVNPWWKKRWKLFCVSFQRNHCLVDRKTARGRRCSWYRSSLQSFADQPFVQITQGGKAGAVHQRWCGSYWNGTFADAWAVHMPWM